MTAVVRALTTLRRGIVVVERRAQQLHERLLQQVRRFVVAGPEHAQEAPQSALVLAHRHRGRAGDR